MFVLILCSKSCMPKNLDYSLPQDKEVTKMKKELEEYQAQHFAEANRRRQELDRSTRSRESINDAILFEFQKEIEFATAEENLRNAKNQAYQSQAPHTV